MEVNFELFYDLAVYANDNWGGGFTEKEIAMNAFDYYNEYLLSVERSNSTMDISILLQNSSEDMNSYLDYETWDMLSSINEAILDGIYH